MKRVVGYNPNKAIQPQKETLPKKEVDAPIEKESAAIGLGIVPELIKTKSKKIVGWINNHKEFKWGAMCKELKIDKSNFQRVLRSEVPEIKVNHIPKIENFLKRYGYVE